MTFLRDLPDDTYLCSECAEYPFTDDDERYRDQYVADGSDLRGQPVTVPVRVFFCPECQQETWLIVEPRDNYDDLDNLEYAR